ncbi:hypothetical protein [Formosa sp. 4Alg 33]|uniref:hypothetical protein n=1 Tax=Formosa sp. 4Alg 33 TaxID=3382189 RepID=UPI003D9C11DE
MRGRSDKLFCDLHCKGAYHYRSALENEPRFFNQVDNQLKQNRRLLKNYNKSGKAIIRKDLLIEEGFNPNYFTHYWKNTKGDVYLFVYEYGFLRKVEHTVEKYVLIKWQEYMEK